MGSPGAIQGCTTLSWLSIPYPIGITHLGHRFFMNVRSNAPSFNLFNIQVAHLTVCLHMYHPNMYWLRKKINILPYLILSYLILSYLILSYLIFSYLILSYLGLIVIRWWRRRRICRRRQQRQLNFNHHPIIISKQVAIKK
jgi:hypothetical protein